jgi:hypothetical protein
MKTRRILFHHGSASTEHVLPGNLTLIQTLPPRSRAPLSTPPLARTPEERGPTDRWKEERVALESSFFRSQEAAWTHLDDVQTPSRVTFGVERRSARAQSRSELGRTTARGPARVAVAVASLPCRVCVSREGSMTTRRHPWPVVASDGPGESNPCAVR